MIYYNSPACKKKSSNHIVASMYRCASTVGAYTIDMLQVRSRSSSGNYKLRILFRTSSPSNLDLSQKSMGIVWEVYHKGVPILGVPENPIELLFQPLLRMIGWIADQLMVQKFPTYSPVEGKLVCLPLFIYMGTLAPSKRWLFGISEPSTVLGGPSQLVEGSLNSKLPTIWRDEKQMR